MEVFYVNARVSRFAKKIDKQFGMVHFRFIYAFHNGSIFILHAFQKKIEQIPNREMAYARQQLKALADI